MKILSILLMLLINKTYASECRTLSTAQGEKALQLLLEADSSELFVVDQYCEHCFDEYPRPILVDSYEIRKTSKKSVELYINGKVMDLAYLYVEGENMALNISCHIIAVSKNLD